jgi:hypothetical protein
MYFEGRAPTSPQISSGEIYPIVIKGHTVYVTKWWWILDSKTSEDWIIFLWASNMLLRYALFQSGKSRETT